MATNTTVPAVVSKLSNREIRNLPSATPHLPQFYHSCGINGSNLYFLGQKAYVCTFLSSVGAHVRVGFGGQHYFSLRKVTRDILPLFLRCVTTSYEINIFFLKEGKKTTEKWHNMHTPTSLFNSEPMTISSVSVFYPLNQSSWVMVII